MTAFRFCCKIRIIMANTSIPNLTAGNPAATGDLLPISRSGANYKVTSESVAALVSSTTINSIVGQLEGVVGGVLSLDGLVHTPITQAVLSSGDNSVFTVPAGKRAMVIWNIYNPSLASQTIYHTISKDAGVTWQRTFPNSVLASGFLTGGVAVENGLVYEAGDRIGINSTATVATLALTAAGNAAGGLTRYTGTITGGASNGFVGLRFTVTGFSNSVNNVTNVLCVASTATTIDLVNAAGTSESASGTLATPINSPVVQGVAYVFNDTSPVKNASTAIGSSWTAGAYRTLYTCPVGKTAFITGNNAFFGGSQQAEWVPVFVNTSGATIIATSHLVKSGDSPSSLNILGRGSVPNNSIAGVATAVALAAGDTIQVMIDTTTTGCFAFWTLCEK
jgi:hypothetical protein